MTALLIISGVYLLIGVLVTLVGFLSYLRRSKS